LRHIQGFYFFRRSQEGRTSRVVGKVDSSSGRWRAAGRYVLRHLMRRQLCFHSRICPQHTAIAWRIIGLVEERRRAARRDREPSRTMRNIGHDAFSTVLDARNRTRV